MSRFRVVAGSLAFVFLASCSTTDSLTTGVVRTQITSAEATGPTDGLPTIAGTNGQLVVEGAMHLPYPCYALEGHTSIEGHNVDVVVDAQPLPGACVAVLSTKRYSLSAGPVPSGTYQVTLTHQVTVNGVTSDSVVAQAIATVP